MGADTAKFLPLLINGEWIEDRTDVITSVNPANGVINHMICAANAQLVERAVESSTRAVNNPQWRNLLPHMRAAILHRISDLMNANSDRFAHLQMIENGKVWSECVAQVKSAAATFRYYAGVCESISAELTPPRGNYISMVTYEPYGVVAAITPWNSPMTMEAQKVAPALAAGNAVILKPSEITSAAALELGRIALEAGLPPGLLNVLPGNGATTGSALVDHLGVKMVSFTGGTASGKRIAQSAAAKLMPVALELGGKSPHIIFADADLKAAVRAVIGGIFEASGQSCVAGSRVFVQKSVYQQVLDTLVEAARALRVDQPDAAGAQMGPIATFAHRERIERMVELARTMGAKIVTGGTKPADSRLDAGAFYMPTIVEGIENHAQIAQEEIFGPVLCALPFSDEEDIVRQANDSVYGLAAGIWTGDYRRAWRVARSLEAGTVWVNTYKQLSISTPFGGYKQSGLGREKGVAGLRLYQQTKSIYMGLDA